MHNFFLIDLETFFILYCENNNILKNNINIFYFICEIYNQENIDYSILNLFDLIITQSKYISTILNKKFIRNDILYIIRIWTILK